MRILKKGLTVLLAGALAIVNTPSSVYAEEQFDETDQIESNSAEENIADDVPSAEETAGFDSEESEAAEEQIESEPLAAEINADQKEFNGFLYTIVSSSTIQIEGYNGTDSNVTIPESIEGYPVTAIKASAFSGNKIITGLVFPQSIRTIGSSAFKGCTSLEKVHFDNTEPLTSEELENTAATIGSRAFANCTALKEINLPENLVSMDYEAFAGTAITSIVIPRNLKKVPTAGLKGTVWYYGPFYKCEKLKEIRFEEGIETIANHLFFSNESIETISIPDTVMSIGSSAFWKVSSLKSVNLSESIHTIGSSAFASCSGLTEVLIPKSVLTIGSSAFASCSGLTEVVIPKSVQTVGDSAFNSCTSLEKVHFENTEPLTAEELESTAATIGGRAFANCTALKEINLPENLTKLDYEALAYTPITSIVIPRNLKEVPYVGLKGSVWYYGPFYKCEKLKEIRFEEGIKTIANHLFFSNKSIETVTIPDTVTSIGSNAFSGISSLKSIILPESVLTIGSSAFESCSGLTEVVIPKSVRTVGNSVFYGCRSLERVRFENTEPLTAEELESTAATIGGRAFANCTALKEINLPENLTKLDYEALAYTPITSIVIPRNLKEVPYVGLKGTVWYYGPFYKCEKLKEIRFEEGIKTIANHLFFSNESIETITVPDTVTSIGTEAFRNCPNLKTVIIPDSVTSFGSSVFASPNVSINCEYYSWAAVYVIDNHKPFAPLSGKITPAAVIDRDLSDYQIDLGGANASGYVNCSVKFSSNVKLSGQKITVYIPDNTELDLDSVKLDGKEFTDFDEDSYNARREIFKVGVNKGELTFGLRVKDSEKVVSYALMTGSSGNKSYKDVIGVVNEAYAGITINAPDRVNHPEIAVTGIATGAESIELYINNTYAQTVKVRKNGSWTTTVTIPDPKDYYAYRLSARFSGSDGQTKHAEKNVVFFSGTPEMNALVMRYTMPAGVVKKNLLTEDGVLPKVYADFAKDYYFEVGFDHPENVKKVYVHSKRNGITKTIEAFWNEKTKMFETEKAFDAESYYVPGKIRVSYETADSKQLIGTDFKNNEELRSIVSLAESCIDDVGLIAEDVKTYKNGKADVVEGNIDISGLINSDTKDILSASVEVIDSLAGTELNEYLGFAFDLYSLDKDIVTLVDGKDGQYVLIKDPSDAKNRTVIIGRVVSGTLNALEDIQKLELFPSDSLPANWIAKLEDSVGMANLSTFADVAVDLYDIHCDTNELIEYINESPDIADKAEATKKAYELGADRVGFVLLSAAMLAIVASSGTAMAGPTAVFGLMLAGMKLMSDGIFGMRGNMIKTGEYRFRSVRDPSGVVTDSVTGEPIEDVTVSAYWIEDTGEDDFFSKKPSDSEYGVLWDALEYEQANPDKTDADGRYHWDVPEGWWRVKYEKDLRSMFQ